MGVYPFLDSNWARLMTGERVEIRIENSELSAEDVSINSAERARVIAEYKELFRDVWPENWREEILSQWPD